MSSRPAYWGFSEGDYTPPCVITSDSQIIDLATAPVQTWAAAFDPEEVEIIQDAVTRWQIAVAAGAAPEDAAGYGWAGEGFGYLARKQREKRTASRRN
ncbi:MAG: hypothetical protein ACR2KU_06420 [Gammaproteobacteria bacterium]